MSPYISITPNTGYTKTTVFSFSADPYTVANYSSFLWNFGDGITSNQVYPTHTYEKSGNFTILLSASDNFGNYVNAVSSLDVGLFTCNKTNGYAKATNFKFSTDPLLRKNYKTFLWNFGDGTYSRNPNPSHTYNLPGDYTVILNAYDNNGNNITYSKKIKVILFLNESLYFHTIPPPTYAGHLNRYPFKINITSSTVDDHYVTLASQFSKSYQTQDPENKWSFLRPQCSFLDLSGNKITQIKTTDTPIRIDDDGNISNTGFVVGVTGTAHFYFSDDLYNTDLFINNDPYSTIIATLQTSAIKSPQDSENLDEKTPSFSNSLASVSMPHIFTWREPDFIKITENGFNKFSKIRFVNQNNPILINFGFNKSYSLDDLPDGNGVSVTDTKKFVHYAPYNSTYNVSLTSYVLDYKNNNLNFSFTPSSLKFEYQDQYGFKTGGYYKGSFISNNSAKNCKIYCESNFLIPELSARYFNPILWISNPAAGMLATAYYFHNPKLSSVTGGYLDRVHLQSFNMPIVESIDNVKFFENDTMAVSGFHGINSIAALPAPTYHAWALDSELNKLYRINSLGDILIDVDLNNVFDSFALTKYVDTQVSPSYMALDSNKNIWITFYDTPYALKFDNFGNYITRTNLYDSFGKFLGISGLNSNDPIDLQRWIDTSSVNDTTDDSNSFEPTAIDTDTNDNIWISYSNPLSGWVIKYNSNGNLINSIPYPVDACPQEIICDNKNNLWVAATSNVGNKDGYLEKRDSTGSLLSSYGPFNNINHLTLDVDQNIWFTYSYQWVGNINDKTGDFYQIKITDNSYSDKVPEWFDANTNADETALEGITCDLFGRIYVINSIENKIFVIDSNTKNLVDKFYINPKGFVFTLSGINSPTQTEFNPWSKSAQATGDWSGFRWANKYIDKSFDNHPYFKSNGSYYKKISGTSITDYNNFDNCYFSFYPKNYYDIFKINENFDFTQKLKSVSFQKSLQESVGLFDNFFNPIFGTAPFEHDDLMVQSYEKISNFVSNQSDIDTCNIDSLYDMAESVGLNTDDFRINYPISIKNSMDLLSINQSRLFGGELNDSFNFSNPNENLNFNRGKLLNSNTYLVSAGVPIILKTKSLKSYRIIETGYIPLTSTQTVLDVSSKGKNYYSLNELASFLKLGNYWNNLYEFYEYVPSTNIINAEGVIDWDISNIDKKLLLNMLKNPNNSSLLNSLTSDYIGWDTDDGVMEFIFTYKLYKGLGLL